MTITHGTAGSRHVVTERPNHKVLVTNRAGDGYVQRRFTVRNQTFVHRTYYAGGVRAIHVYRPFVFRGVVLDVYAPDSYYSPEFYGWAYSPWAAPVPFRWDWMGSPWFLRSGGYFRPYPVYTSAALWLTDYLVAATLQKGYRDHLGAEAPAAGASPMTLGVKQAIAAEIRWQLALEYAERQTLAQNSLPDPGSSGIARMLTDNIAHVFVVSSDLNVNAGGQECTLRAGDVLQLNGGPAPNASSADLRVLASNKQSCGQGSVVSTPIEDLQEMQNYMRSTIDQGLAELRSHRAGLPAPPVSAMAAPVQAFAGQAPQPDQNDASELSQQAMEADQAEQDVVTEALAPDTVTPLPASDVETSTISLGQTASQVVAILSTPRNIVDLGAKQLYIYRDMKITFTAGRLSDVQ